MSASINHTSNALSSVYNHLPTNRAVENSGKDEKENSSQGTSKFVIEDKTILYERYDRYGKLISRVPWSAKTISENA